MMFGPLSPVLLSGGFLSKPYFPGYGLAFQVFSFILGQIFPLLFGQVCFIQERLSEYYKGRFGVAGCFFGFPFRCIIRMFGCCEFMRAALIKLELERDVGVTLFWKDGA